MKNKRRDALRAWILVVVLFISVMSPSIGTIRSKAATKMGVTYTVHVQTYGDAQGWVSNGASAGTSGQAKRLEEIRIKLTGDEYTGGIRYKTHIQTFGWQNWSADGVASGSRGLSKRLEGIEIELTGEVAEHYDVVYRVHCQTYGWLDWVQNGQMAGTSGQAKRLEAIQIKLVPKTSIVEMGVQYRTHCQTYGWLNWSMNGSENGTTGQSKRLEGIEIKLNGNRYSGGIEYRTHVQTYGWEKSMVSNGAMSGTTGKAKRLEAIEIKLYGEVADYYDVYYRVHAQTYGWLGWVKNGQKSGTSGLAKRLEAIQIKLVPKGGDSSAYNNAGAGYVQNTSQTTPQNTQQPSPQNIYSSNDAYIQKVIELVNVERRKAGVAPLTMNKDLTVAANVRAKEISQLFDHYRPDGTDCFTAFPSTVEGNMGENIAAGQRTPENVVETWMNSPGHRRNILDPNYRVIGVGFYQNNSGYRTHWTQLFAGYAR